MRAVALQVQKMTIAFQGDGPLDFTQMRLPPCVVLFSVLFTISASVMADIQEPPMTTQGPGRKLSRGLANILTGASEIPIQVVSANETEGNSAIIYGAVRGFTRFIARLGCGVYEVITFPFPTNKGTYFQPYTSNIPWVNSGMEEFPPELGFETRYRYVRDYSGRR